MMNVSVNGGPDWGVVVEGNRLLVSEPLNIMHVLMGPAEAQKPALEVQRLVGLLRAAGLHPRYNKRTTDGGLPEFYEIWIPVDEYDAAGPIVEAPEPVPLPVFAQEMMITVSGYQALCERVTFYGPGTDMEIVYRFGDLYRVRLTGAQDALDRIVKAEKAAIDNARTVRA